MVRLLEFIKKNPYVSTIEGTLIDLFLDLLFNPNDTELSGKSSIKVTQSLYHQLARTHSGQPIVEFKLKPTGESYIVNYLKMLMESTRLNTSTFFSTEVLHFEQRIVVSLVRRLCNKSESFDEQKELVLKTLVVILERLIETSPQVIPYFLESYLREFQLKRDDTSHSLALFEELQNRFTTMLASHSVFSSSLPSPSRHQHQRVARQDAPRLPAGRQIPQFQSLDQQPDSHVGRLQPQKRTGRHDRLPQS